MAHRHSRRVAGVRTGYNVGIKPHGFEFEVRPQMFIGATANPFAGPNVAMRVSRLAKKAAAGVQFVQTQCIYNMETFKDFHENHGGPGFA